MVLPVRELTDIIFRTRVQTLQLMHQRPSMLLYHGRYKTEFISRLLYHGKQEIFSIVLLEKHNPCLKVGNITSNTMYMYWSFAVLSLSVLIKQFL